MVYFHLSSQFMSLTFELTFLLALVGVCILFYFYQHPILAWIYICWNSSATKEILAFIFRKHCFFFQGCLSYTIVLHWVLNSNIILSTQFSTSLTAFCLFIKLLTALVLHLWTWFTYINFWGEEKMGRKNE